MIFYDIEFVLNLAPINMLIKKYIYNILPTW